MCIRDRLSITEGCDLAVCGKDSRFGLTELQNGLFPMIALAINGKSIPKKRLFEIIYESKEIDAQTACDWHIVNAVSYTHLDVYKRQECPCSCCMPALHA